MQNTSKLNTILLVIIIILLVIGLGYFILRDSKEKETSKLVNDVAQENIKVDSSTNNNINQKDWSKSTKFGLYYPESFNPPTEFYRVSGLGSNRGSIVYEPSTDTVPVFSLVFNDGNAVITWGDVWKGGYLPGTCTELEFGVFEYGVSGTACLKGYRTWVSHFSARDNVTENELKTFGDFVLKNK
jgi:hypothetical protein